MQLVGDWCRRGRPGTSSSEKSTGRIGGSKRPASTASTALVIVLPVDRLELHDVARLEEDHELAEVAVSCSGIVDRHRRDAEHLVAAGAAHRVDAAEAAAVADGQLGRVGARAQIFRHLDLLLALDHLVHERQAGDEADHRDEPGRAGMGGDEVVDAAIAVDAGGVFEVGAGRVLVALAKAHQRLVRPRVVVEHRDLDDPRRQRRRPPWPRRPRAS